MKMAYFFTQVHFMKIIRSSRADIRLNVSLRSKMHTIAFYGHEAAVPNRVADLLLAVHPGLTMVRDMNAEPPKSMLIVRDGGIGDIMLITPLVRYWASRGVAVDFETLFAHKALLEGNPYIRRVYGHDPPNMQERASHCETPPYESYDCIVNLEWYVENLDAEGILMHRAIGFAHYCDVELSGDDLSLDYAVTETERAWAKEELDGMALVRGVADRPWLAYVHEATSSTRAWSAETHRNVLKCILNEAAVNVVLLGRGRFPRYWSLRDGPPQGVWDATGMSTIRKTAALIERSAAVITPDTGLFHIAQALRRPIITYFGSFPLSERATRPLDVIQIGSPERCSLTPCRSYLCLVRDEGTLIEEGRGQRNPPKVVGRVGGGQPRCLQTDEGRVVQALHRALAASAA